MYLIKRSGYYHVEYFDINLGKVRRVTTHASSKKYAAKFLSDFKNNMLHSHDIHADITMMEFQERYIEFAKISFSKSYIRSINLSFDMLTKFSGNIKVFKVDKILAEKFLVDTFKRANYSARMYHRTLKAAFSKAVTWQIISVNPFVGIKLQRPQKNLPKFLSLAQFDFLMTFEGAELFKQLYTFAFNTGLRLSEITNLKWENIDDKSKLLYVRNCDTFTTKSKAERVIPLNETAFNIFERRRSSRRSHSIYVFTNETGCIILNDQVSKRFKRCIKKSGIDDSIHFHTLRHSFASNLAQQGVPLFHIKNLLGHSSIITTEIYSHVNNENLRDAVDKLC